MEDRDRDVLQKKRMYLSKNIGKTQIVNVVNQLYSQDILTNDDKELILSKVETSDHVYCRYCRRNVDRVSAEYRSIFR